MARLDLTYYSGQDVYSDGTVEDRILDYISEYPAEEYDAALEADRDMAVFYHLSDVRQALLNWYDFRPGCSILEVGGGMGALTGLLCDRGGTVVSVELSAKRAEAIARRCQDRDNLTIMVGDLNDMEFEGKFDYITLIGVLEHQSAVSDDPDAHEKFLRRLVSLLAPGGRLLIAIENRFGLKYWCGEVDDHTGIPFGTLRQNHYEGKPRTFDRSTLQEMLKRAGVPETKFYYPLPDYKFPRVIYSDDCLPEQELNSAVFPLHYSNYYPWQPLVAEEEKLYAPIIANGVFPFFANSFLVEAGAAGTAPGNVDFASVTVEREKRYRQIIRLKNGRFEKYAACPEGRAHIEESFANLEALRERGLPVLSGELEDGRISMPRISAPTVEDLLLDRLSEGQRSEALALIDEHYDRILRSSPQIPDERNRLLDDASPAAGYSFGPILERGYADMIFSNCFAEGDGLIYDQEWVFERCPAGFIMFRAVSVLYNSHGWIENVLPRGEVLERFRISPELAEVYGELEAALFAGVQNDATCAVIGTLRQYDPQRIEENIGLLQNGLRDAELLRGQISQQETIAEEQLRQLEARECVIREKDAQIEGRDTVIREKDAQIEGRDTVIREKDAQIEGRDTVIREKDAQIEGRDTVIREKDTQIEGRDSVIRAKLAELETMEAELRNVREQLADVTGQLREAERVVESFHGKNLQERLRIAMRCMKG